MSDVLSRLLVTQKVDLLTVHWMTYDTTALISCAMKAEIPFVFINHFQNRRLLLPRTRRWITRAAGIGTVSKWGIPEELSGRTVNLSDAVDTQFFDPEKARPVDFGERRVVLMTARIAPGKGHADLIEAARILISRNLDLALCFVGAVDSECLYQELGRLAAVKGLRQRVFFLGERSQEEIRDWYALSSVVVLPSYAEGLPRVVLEAQAMKRPVVAYDCGGPSEAMLPNETGFLVTPGDVAGLAERIGFLLGNEAERLRMGERGRAFVVGQFGLSALVERHEALYCKVLSGDSLAIRAQRGVKTARLE
jgi:glycosyltransferase involved in cell wall biosynthesis